MASLEAHLEDLFRSTEPAAKEIISLLTRGAVLPEQACRTSPLAIAEEMGSWGAGFVEELEPLLRDYGLLRDIDRYAMFLIYDRGSVRPTALADELLLTTGAVTGVLDHIEGASLIERTRLPNTRDRRAVVVLATDRGADAAQAMLRVLDRRSEALCAVFAQTLRT